MKIKLSPAITAMAIQLLSDISSDETQKKLESAVPDHDIKLSCYRVGDNVIRLDITKKTKKQ